MSLSAGIREDGRVEERVVNKKIFKLYRENKSPQEIAEICKIPLDEVQEFFD